MGVGGTALGHPRYTRERCGPSWLHRNGGQRCSHLLRRSPPRAPAEILIGKSGRIDGFRGNPGFKGPDIEAQLLELNPSLALDEKQKAAQEEEARAKAAIAKAKHTLPSRKPRKAKAEAEEAKAANAKAEEAESSAQHTLPRAKTRAKGKAKGKPGRVTFADPPKEAQPAPESSSDSNEDSEEEGKENSSSSESPPAKKAKKGASKK